MDAFMADFLAKAAAETLPDTAPASVHDALVDLGIVRYARFYHVEPDYYDWPLERRAERLSAPSTAHLCKSVVFENTRWTGTPSSSPFDTTNPRYLTVIVQYTDKLNSAALNNFVSSLSGMGGGRLGAPTVAKKRINMRVTGEDVAGELTGFEKNGVCPVGMRERAMPVVVTRNVASVDGVVWLGAGHVDWKVALPVRTLMKHCPWFVADLA
ncbi:hypothetical protein BC831DRAFT_243841 [Entophlyctis helioformis]|nr:hypothetical protein BC831DRAFT_243841 [Entophlyctis helioformis]